MRKNKKEVFEYKHNYANEHDNALDDSIENVASFESNNQIQTQQT